MPSAFRRRATLAAAVALPLVLIATGCTATDDAVTSDVPSSEPTGLGTFPVTLEHQFGEIEIPEEPTRIVVLGLSDQDALLALGSKPIAVSEWYGGYEHATWEWAQDELGDWEPVVLNDGVRDEANPPIEEIAALQPDLIISLYNGTTEEQYEQLSAFAPVVVPDEEFANFAITWEESLRVIGEALGREDDALELVAELEQKMGDAAAAHPEFQGVEVIIGERFEPGMTLVRRGADMRARFFDQLGFTVPEGIDGIEPDEYGDISVSDELMGLLSRDLLVWNTGFNPEIRAEIEAAPLYATLPVVQAGNVLWIEDELVSGAFTWGTILSLEYALEQLLPQISEVVD